MPDVLSFEDAAPEVAEPVSATQQPDVLSFEDAAPEPTELSSTDRAALAKKTIADHPEFGTLREPTFAEQVKSHPLYRAIFGGNDVEKEGQKEMGGANVTPIDILNTGFKFAAIPPQAAEPIRKGTDWMAKMLPDEAQGVAIGAREVGLNFPIAAAPVAMGSILGKALLGVFTGEFVLSIPEQKAEFDAAMARGDKKEAYKIATMGILNGALLTAGVKHEISGMRKSAPVEAPVTEPVTAHVEQPPKELPDLPEGLVYKPSSIPGNPPVVERAIPRTRILVKSPNENPQQFEERRADFKRTGLVPEPTEFIPEPTPEPAPRTQPQAIAAAPDPAVAPPVAPIVPPEPKEIPPLFEGERLVTVKRPDGSTYKASYAGKTYGEWDGKELPAIGIPTTTKEGVMWSHTPLPDGHEIIDDIPAPAKASVEPTPAQKESGKYPKEKVDVDGITVAIENTKGSVRTGTDKNGQPWEVTMPAHYGEVEGSKGADGDKVDAYLGETPNDTVWVIDQKDPETQKHDEAKAFLNFGSRAEVEDTYKRAFSDGSGESRMAGITEMTKDEFKKWVKSDRAKKAFLETPKEQVEMPSGVHPTDRAFMAAWSDSEGESREYGNQRDLLTFDEADKIAKENGGMVIGWDENGKQSSVVDYSKSANPPLPKTGEVDSKGRTSERQEFLSRMAKKVKEVTSSGESALPKSVSRTRPNTEAPSEFLKAAKSAPKNTSKWPKPTKPDYVVVFKPYGENGRGFYQIPELKRESVTPSQDKQVGKNDAGEQLYERADGSRYRMRFDSPRTKPNGYPDFGGDLAPVEEPKVDILKTVEFAGGPREYTTLTAGDLKKPEVITRLLDNSSPTDQNKSKQNSKRIVFLKDNEDGKVYGVPFFNEKGVIKIGNPDGKGKAIVLDKLDARYEPISTLIGTTTVDPKTVFVYPDAATFEEQVGKTARESVGASERRLEALQKNAVHQTINTETGETFEKSGTDPEEVAAAADYDNLIDGVLKTKPASIDALRDLITDELVKPENRDVFRYGIEQFLGKLENDPAFAAQKAEFVTLSAEEQRAAVIHAITESAYEKSNAANGQPSNAPSEGRSADQKPPAGVQGNEPGRAPTVPRRTRPNNPAGAEASSGLPKPVERPILPHEPPKSSRTRPLLSEKPTEVPAVVTLDKSNVETDAKTNIPESTTKKPFDGKAAKEQKKFLLSAVDQAIKDAPDVSGEETNKQWQASPQYLDDQAAREWMHNNPEPKIIEYKKYDQTEEDYQAQLQTERQAVIDWHKKADTDLGHLAQKYAAEAGGDTVSTIYRGAKNAFYQTLPHITIQVPGDGEFSVINTKSALADFKERAKTFPTTLPKMKEPGFSRETATAPAALGKMDAENIVKALAPHVSDDPNRKQIHMIWSDGKQSVATNGRLLVRVEKGLGGSEKSPQVFSTEGKAGKRMKPDASDFYPNWRQVIPTESKLDIKGVDTAKLFTLIRQAQEVTSDRANSVKLFFNKDGTVGVKAESPEIGTYESNVQDKKNVIALNPEYALDILNSARRVGHEKVDIHFIDELSPIRFTAKGFDATLMPMRLSSLTEAAPEVPYAIPGYQIPDAVESFKQANPKAPEIEVVHRPDWTENGYGVRGVWQDGRMIINTAYTGSTREALGVIQHEWSHGLLRSAEGTKALLEFAQRTLPAADMAELGKKYLKDKGESDEDYRLRLVSEWVARKSEAQPGVWQRMVSRVREWLSKAGIVNLTDEEAAAAMLRRLKAGADGNYVKESKASYSLADDPEDVIRQSENAEELPKEPREILRQSLTVQNQFLHEIPAFQEAQKVSTGAMNKMPWLRDLLQAHGQAVEQHGDPTHNLESLLADPRIPQNAKEVVAGDAMERAAKTDQQLTRTRERAQAQVDRRSSEVADMSKEIEELVTNKRKLLEEIVPGATAEFRDSLNARIQASKDVGEVEGLKEGKRYIEAMKEGSAEVERVFEALTKTVDPKLLNDPETTPAMIVRSFLESGPSPKELGLTLSSIRNGARILAASRDLNEKIQAFRLLDEPGTEQSVRELIKDLKAEVNKGAKADFRKFTEVTANANKKAGKMAFLLSALKPKVKSRIKSLGEWQQVLDATTAMKSDSAWTAYKDLAFRQAGLKESDGTVYVPESGPKAGRMLFDMENPLTGQKVTFDVSLNTFDNAENLKKMQSLFADLETYVADRTNPNYDPIKANRARTLLQNANFYLNPATNPLITQKGWFGLPQWMLSYAAHPSKVLERVVGPVAHQLKNSMQALEAVGAQLRASTESGHSIVNQIAERARAAKMTPEDWYEGVAKRIFGMGQELGAVPVKVGDMLFGHTVTEADMRVIRSIKDLTDNWRNISETGQGMAEVGVNPARIRTQYGERTAIPKSGVGLDVPRIRDIAKTEQWLKEWGARDAAGKEAWLNQPENFKNILLAHMQMNARVPTYQARSRFREAYKAIAHEVDAGASTAPTNLDEVVQRVADMEDEDSLLTKDQIKARIMGEVDGLFREVGKQVKDASAKKVGPIMDIIGDDNSFTRPRDDRPKLPYSFMDYAFHDYSSMVRLANDAKAFYVNAVFGQHGALEKMQFALKDKLADMEAQRKSSGKSIPEFQAESKEAVRRGEELYTYEELKRINQDVNYVMGELKKKYSSPDFGPPGVGETLSLSQGAIGSTILAGLPRITHTMSNLLLWSRLSKLLTNSIARPSFANTVEVVKSVYKEALSFAHTKDTQELKRQVESGELTGMMKSMAESVIGYRDDIERLRRFGFSGTGNLSAEIGKLNDARQELFNPLGDEGLTHRAGEVSKAALRALTSGMQKLPINSRWNDRVLSTLAISTRRRLETMFKANAMEAFDARAATGDKSPLTPQELIGEQANVANAEQVRQLFADHGMDIDRIMADYYQAVKKAQAEGQSPDDVPLLTPGQQASLDFAILTKTGLGTSMTRNVFGQRGPVARMFSFIHNLPAFALNELGSTFNRISSEKGSEYAKRAIPLAITMGAAAMIYGILRMQGYATAAKVLYGQSTALPQLSNVRDSKDAAKLGIRALAGFMPVVGDIINGIILNTPDRMGHLDSQVVLIGFLNDLQHAARDVIQSGDASGPAMKLIRRWAPLSRVVLSRLPAREGLNDYWNSVNDLRVGIPSTMESKSRQSSDSAYTPGPITASIQAMKNAAYRGDQSGFMQAYNQAVEIKRGLGEKHPETAVKAAWSAGNPWLEVLKTLPTESERDLVLSRLTDSQRAEFLKSEGTYKQFGDLIGDNVTFTQEEKQGARGGGGGSVRASGGTSDAGVGATGALGARGDTFRSRTRFGGALAGAGGGSGASTSSGGALSVGGGSVPHGTNRLRIGGSAHAKRSTGHTSHAIHRISNRLRPLPNVRRINARRRTRV